MRKDARRVKEVTGMQQILYDIVPTRFDSYVYINQEMDVTKLVEYVQKKKKKNPDITYFHAFVAAIAKVIYNRKKFNYFVANRHLWEHKEIVISFVAKIEFSDNAEEMMILIPIDDKDNIDTISKKIKDKVDAIRVKKVNKKGANSIIDTVGKLPNFIRVPFLGIVKWLDRKGMLPASFIEDNLYYSSIILSNLGSIHCGAISHHMVDFGTCSSLATIGEIKSKEVLVDKKKKEIRDVVEFGITIDERIGDGYYFAKSLKYFQYIFDNPKTLEEDVSTKMEI